MAEDANQGLPDIAQRITQARLDAGLTQADLAGALTLDRTAVAKIESGKRRVTASELVAIASVLDRPIDWFVEESPPAVVSRRIDNAVGGISRSLDLKVEQLAREVAFLVSQNILSEPTDRTPLAVPTDHDEAETAAIEARSLLGVASGPLYDLQRVAEFAGLLAFSLDLGADGGDAAYVEVGHLGVAVINGAIDPGRRRFNLAHELGHHLFGDAYAPEVAVGSGSEVERLINSFAIHFLLPRADVTEFWRAHSDLEPRLAAVGVAYQFRASWGATCNQLRTIGLISAQDRERYADRPPTAADSVALGERWFSELDPPSIPPDYGKRVLSAFENGKLSADRTTEMLWGTVPRRDLPEQHQIPLDALRREFDMLP